MKSLSLIWVCFAMAAAQQNDAPTVRQDQVPIYRVTVERRAIRAVNYGHRTVPTKIDFRGTVLLPRAAGEAKVTAKAGAVEVDAKFEKLDSPSRFGNAYLTYVLWAITPDGRPVNLGEVITGHSNNARLKVTTQLQTFGLIVTAEPYFSVTQPSNVVVLENMLRPDTVGKVAEVEARYELLSRGDQPMGTRQVELQQPANNAEPVSMERYEAIVAVYQAQNALQIARAQGAERYAPETLAKADQLFQHAQRLNGEKGDSKRVVMMAREATQTAEDARVIAMKHTQKDQAIPETKAGETARR